MVSAKSHRPVIWAVRLGSILRLAPICWDLQNSCIRLRKPLPTVRFRICPARPFAELVLSIDPFQWIHAFYGAVLLVHYFSAPFLHSESALDVCVGFLVGLATYFGFMANVSILLSPQEFCSSWNAVIKLDKAMLTFFGRNEDEPDGQEPLVYGLLVIGIGVSVAIFPVTFFVLRSEKLLMAGWFLDFLEYCVPVPRVVHIVGVSLGHVGLSIIAWTYVTLTTSIMLLYVGSLSSWMIQLRKSWIQMMGNPSQTRRIHQFYRQAQILHTAVTDKYRVQVLAYITGGEVGAIATAYFVIRELNAEAGTLIRIIAAAVGLIVLFCLKAGIEYSARVLELSTTFSSSPHIANKQKLTKEARCLLKSCRPMAINVGGTYTITRKTFPTIFLDIILGTLINLLVTF